MKVNIFKILGIVFLAAAAGLTAYNLYAQSAAGKMSEAALNELSAAIPETKEEFSEEDTAGLLQEQIEYPDYILNPEMDMPAVEIDNYEYCGTVSIPALGIKLPVINEWSYPALRVAPCRYTGSPYLNDLIICAHNYSTHFGGIKNLSIGDEIDFTDNYGYIFRYRVTEVEELGPYDSQPLLENNYGITLFTCTIGGRTRVVVRGEKWVRE